MRNSEWTGDITFLFPDVAWIAIQAAEEVTTCSKRETEDTWLDYSET